MKVRLALLLLVIACSGNGAIEVPPGLEDTPTECIEALVGYLQAIEPAVEGVDFATATPTELDEVSTQVEALGEEYAADLEGLRCPDPQGSGGETFAAVIALAEAEAPGSVPYLEWIQGFVDPDVTLEEASGDCATDIAALDAIIDEGTPMTQLTMAEVVEVGGLVASISTVCSPERAEEYLSQQRVVEFLEG